MCVLCACHLEWSFDTPPGRRRRRRPCGGRTTIIYYSVLCVFIRAIIYYYYITIRLDFWFLFSSHSIYMPRRFVFHMRTQYRYDFCVEIFPSLCVPSTFVFFSSSFLASCKMLPAHIVYNVIPCPST